MLYCKISKMMWLQLEVVKSEMTNEKIDTWKGESNKQKKDNYMNELYCI